MGSICAGRPSDKGRAYAPVHPYLTTLRIGYAGNSSGVLSFYLLNTDTARL